MRDVPTEDSREGVTLPGVEPSPSDDEFIYHLYRGSELLMQDRVVEAKDELEQALSMQPQDAKGQDLLAGVYFRLGVYPRAIEIWRTLVEAYPRDPTLRVNLSLTLLKTGQPAEALEHLRSALQLSPDHGRAWGYLGIVHWRMGQLEKAREAFLRGGQAAMARRMEEIIASTTAAGQIEAPRQGTRSAGDRAAMRSAAEQAIERFEAEQVPLAVEEQASKRPSGAWRVGEPGAEPTPTVHVVQGRAADAPAALGSQLGRWTVAMPEGAPLAVGPQGALHLSAKASVYCRLDGLRAVRGELRTTPVQRRTRGRELAELLGGDDPVMLWRGPVAAVIEPPPGRSFHAMGLEDDILFVREELLWAFDERVGFENGKVPLRQGELQLVQLYGTGVVALALERPPTALPVADGEEVRVVPAALVGWTGRLLPRGPRARGTAPYSASAPPLAFRGEGTILVT